MNEFAKELTGEQKKLKGDNSAVNYSEIKMYEQFYIDYSVSEKVPQRAGFDARFLTQIQKQKLKSMGIQSTETVMPILFSETKSHTFSDENFILKRLSKPFYRKLTLKSQNGKKFHIKDTVFTETNVIYSRPNAVSDKEKLNCPQCGHITELKQLEQECEICGKSSFITDLFPKIKAFFYKKSYTISTRDIGKVLLICCIFGMLLGIPFGITGFIKDISGIFTKDTITESIKNFFIAPIKGIMIGVIVSIFYLLIKLVYNNVKISPFIKKTNESIKQIASVITEYEGKFCYENFEAIIISLIKLVLFCDDRENLVNCKLKSPSRKFNIIDTTYKGFIDLKKINVEYGLCTIILDVHMLDIYYNKKNFIKKDDIFTIEISKRLTKKTDINFEISNATCPVCFERYNAYTNTECTFCASEYRLDEKDWVITDLKIK